MPRTHSASDDASIPRRLESNPTPAAVAAITGARADLERDRIYYTTTAAPSVLEMATDYGYTVGAFGTFETGAGVQPVGPFVVWPGGAYAYVALGDTVYRLVHQAGGSSGIAAPVETFSAAVTAMIDASTDGAILLIGPDVLWYPDLGTTTPVTVPSGAIAGCADPDGSFWWGLPNGSVVKQTVGGTVLHGPVALSDASTVVHALAYDRVHNVVYAAVDVRVFFLLASGVGGATATYAGATDPAGSPTTLAIEEATPFFEGYRGDTPRLIMPNAGGAGLRTRRLGTYYGGGWDSWVALAAAGIARWRTGPPPSGLSWQVAENIAPLSKTIRSREGAAWVDNGTYKGLFIAGGDTGNGSGFASTMQRLAYGDGTTATATLYGTVDTSWLARGLAYHPVRNRLYLLSLSTTSSPHDRLRAFDLTTLTTVATGSFAPTVPYAKVEYGSWMVLDADADKVYVREGFGVRFYAYDLAAGTWATLASGYRPMPYNKGVLIDGPDGKEIHTIGLNDVTKLGPYWEVYHVGSNTWEDRTADLPAVVAAAMLYTVGAVDPALGAVLFWNNEAGGKPNAGKMALWDTVLDSWHVFTNPQLSLAGMGDLAFIGSGRFWAAGGVGPSGAPPSGGLGSIVTVRRGGV